MQGKARQSKARQGKARQDKARQDKAREGKAKQGKAGQCRTRQSKPRQGKAIQDSANHGETMQDQSTSPATNNPMNQPTIQSVKGCFFKVRILVVQGCKILRFSAIGPKPSETSAQLSVER